MVSEKLQKSSFIQLGKSAQISVQKIGTGVNSVDQHRSQIKRSAQSLFR